MQPIICKNCEHVFQGNFCNQCGQKSKTQRLDIHYINDELKYTFLHLNKGLLYTAKHLFTRPGHAIREFLEGKRVNHYKPLLLVFVLAGLMTVIMHYTTPENLSPFAKDQETARRTKQFFIWSVEHNTFIQLFLIPMYAFCSWLAFKKWGYNYIENIVINSFIGAQVLIFTIITSPITYFCKDSVLYILVSPILGIGTVSLIIWTYIQLFKGKDLGEIILRLLLLFVLITISILIIFAVGIGIAYAITGKIWLL